MPGTVSVYSERVVGGRYVTVDIDRKAAARFALNIADVQEVVRTALGGMRVTQTVEGLERYPVNIRYPRDVRDSLEKLRNLPIVTPGGAHIPLAEVADIRIDDGPGMIKTENARLNGWIYVDIEGRDLGTYVAEAQRVVREQVQLPPGYSMAWSGQYEYLVRARQQLATVLPVTLAIIVLLLYLNFRRFTEVVHHHGHAAAGAGRRLLAAVPAGLQHVGRGRRRLYRAGRRRRGDRRHHAGVSQPGAAAMPGSR